MGIWIDPSASVSSWQVTEVHRIVQLAHQQSELSFEGGSQARSPLLERLSLRELEMTAVPGSAARQAHRPRQIRHLQCL